MPRYSFECLHCNVRFERTLKMSADSTVFPCPECGDDAPRLFDGQGFGFGFANNGARSGAANTGVHDQDYPTADKAVGRSSEGRWAHIHEREKVKSQARDQGGTRALIRHNGEGFIDYEPMTEVGVEQRRRLVRKAIEVERQAKDSGDR